MKLRGPTDSGETDMIPQYVVASVATIVLLCLVASVQARNGRATERVKLPKEAIARLPAADNRRELLLSIAFPSTAANPRGGDIPLVIIDEKEVSLDRIAPELERVRQRLERGQTPVALEEITVLIRADADIPAGAVQQLVKNCQDAGFQRFSLKDTEDAP
ncbi:MAG: biopolymer transporter ExbD [Planctomycetaceae bacterium]|nr:biopolymer transporter ExbD [Planctomycetaceae bacterium]